MTQICILGPNEFIHYSSIGILLKEKNPSPPYCSMERGTCNCSALSDMDHLCE